MNQRITEHDGAEAGPTATGPRLLPGAEHFIVREDPAYEPTGSGEHLYLHLEKEGHTTDTLALALAKVFRVKTHSVGYAGRKDRHAITRQWFSVHTPADLEESRLQDLLPPGGRCTVLAVSRHRNKLRLGHLRGNRFDLGIVGLGEDDLRRRCADLHHHGLINRFGAQRFGHGQATLRMVFPWDQGDWEGVVSIVLGRSWRDGDAVDHPRLGGPEGRLLGFLRRGLPAERAVHATGENLRQLVASAGQSAIFNAVVEARRAAGLLHRPVAGEIATIPSGAGFVVATEDEADVQRRAAPGVLQAFATGPLPGASMRCGDEASIARELAWSAPATVPWSVFDRGRPLESPGERRPIIVPLRDPPIVTAAADHLRLHLALPAGAYASQALEQMGITMPADRRG